MRSALIVEVIGERVLRYHVKYLVFRPVYVADAVDLAHHRLRAYQEVIKSLRIHAYLWLVALSLKRVISKLLGFSHLLMSIGRAACDSSAQD